LAFLNITFAEGRERNRAVAISGGAGAAGHRRGLQGLRGEVDSPSDLG
jgi:hypothetical protein